MKPEYRVATTDDAEQIAQIYAPFCTAESAVSFEITPPTSNEMAERILSTLSKLPWLVAVHEAKVIAYAYASPHKARAAYSWSVDLAIYAGPEARKSGIGTGLCSRLFSILRALGYYNIYAGTTLPNPASESLFLKLGFEHIAVYKHVGHKAGKWHDVAWYGLDLLPSQVNPNDPLSFKELPPKTLHDLLMHAGGTQGLNEEAKAPQ
jgi:L-amino acid N-acyltransferase YncA